MMEVMGEQTDVLMWVNIRTSLRYVSCKSGFTGSGGFLTCSVKYEDNDTGYEDEETRYDYNEV